MAPNHHPSVILTDGKNPPAKPLIAKRSARFGTRRFARGCFAAARHDGVVWADEDFSTVKLARQSEK
jgi:hypothetical protein